MKPAPDKRRVNLSGIIPISGRDNMLGMPWPDCLQYLAPEIPAVLKSVYECALVGCSTIWVVCNDHCLPTVREVLGDYVLDPQIYDSWNFKKIPHLSKEYIPIFYTPVPQKDRFRRDSLGWSVLQGSLTSFLVSNKISKWTRPTGYFVSFPYGLYDPFCLKAHRAMDLRLKISSSLFSPDLIF